MTKSLDDKEDPEKSSGICMAAVIPVRHSPREQSEMINQLLFGESYFIEEYLEGWLKITSLFDHITGWIDRKFFREAELENGRGSEAHAVLYSRLAEIEMPDGTSQLIPAGSSLSHYDPAYHEFRIGRQKFRINPVWGEILRPASQKVTETAGQFMNTPYLWGGRSVFGFDCSGFIQTVYKIHGIALPRNTSQQLSAGQTIPDLKDTVPGDLAFFCNKENKVNHVGMILAGNQIIHCSGWVRVDGLDEKGIFNRELRAYSHRLMEVRRVVLS
jgi:gamma-D-glutamyl-L-lysine dipeptidyl-peptidase